jgi:hypothetical protein
VIRPENRVERVSVLAVDAATAWAEAVDPACITDEMMPLARMTIPKRLRDRGIDKFPIGTTAGRCWLLLFGFIPVDYDDLCVVELEREGPRYRFRERSRMSMLAVWEHERIVEPLGEAADAGSRVTDRLGFELKPLPARIPGTARLARAIIAGFFAHRHRRLQRRRPRLSS